MYDQNQRLATLFRSLADRLATQRANPYRIRAYRRAADSILALQEDISAVATRGALEDIPGVGRDLSEKIREFLATGTLRVYEELNTPLPPEVAAWNALPGLSDSLIGYLYHRLGIRTLVDLETLVRSHLLRTMPGYSGSEEALLQAIHMKQQPTPTKKAESP